MEASSLLNAIEILEKIKKDFVFSEKIENNLFNIMICGVKDLNPTNNTRTLYAKFLLNNIEYRIEEECDVSLDENKSIQIVLNKLAKEISIQILNNIKYGRK